MSGPRLTACFGGVPALLTAAAALLMTVATAPAASGTGAASGPPAKPGLGAASSWCIAGLCLGAPEKEILQRFGTGRLLPEDAPFERCYQARGKSIYLTAVLDGEDAARRVAAVLLSGELTCSAAGPARFAPDRSGCRGLRLFDPAEALSSLGATPLSPRDKGYPWRGSPPEVIQYDYRCEPERECSVMGSAFVRDRTIVAVAIWEPDC